MAEKTVVRAKMAEKMEARVTKAISSKVSAIGAGRKATRRKIAGTKQQESLERRKSSPPKMIREARAQARATKVARATNTGRGKVHPCWRNSSKRSGARVSR